MCKRNDIYIYIYFAVYLYIYRNDSICEQILEPCWCFKSCPSIQLIFSCYSPWNNHTYSQDRLDIGESNIFIFHWTMFDGETLNYNNFSTQSSLRWHTIGTTNSPGLRTPAGILEVAYQLLWNFMQLLYTVIRQTARHFVWAAAISMCEVLLTAQFPFQQTIFASFLQTAKLMWIQALDLWVVVGTYTKSLNDNLFGFGNHLLTPFILGIQNPYHQHLWGVGGFGGLMQFFMSDEAWHWRRGW